MKCFVKKVMSYVAYVEWFYFVDFIYITEQLLVLCLHIWKSRFHMYVWHKMFIFLWFSKKI